MLWCTTDSRRVPFRPENWEHRDPRCFDRLSCAPTCSVRLVASARRCASQIFSSSLAVRCAPTPHTLLSLHQGPLRTVELRVGMMFCFSFTPDCHRRANQDKHLSQAPKLIFARPSIYPPDHESLHTLPACCSGDAGSRRYTDATPTMNLPTATVCCNRLWFWAIAVCRFGLPVFRRYAR